MSKEKSSLELWIRKSVRVFACICLALLMDVMLAIFFFLWSITFYPVLAYNTEQVFTLIFINLGFFIGTCIAGYLSGNLKRSLVVSIVVSVILGTVFIVISGALIGIINIVVIAAAGLIGGYIIKTGYFKEN